MLRVSKHSEPVFSNLLAARPERADSPPEKNVPMMFPRVIGSSRCDGCDSSWCIMMRSGRWRRRWLRAKLRINASIALPGLRKDPNLNSQLPTESVQRIAKNAENHLAEMKGVAFAGSDLG